MKSFLLALAAAVVGIAAGLAVSWWRCGSPSSGNPFDVGTLHARAAANRTAPTGQAGLVVILQAGGTKGTFQDADNELIFDFGAMPQQSTGNVEFLFRNEGTLPIELTKGKTTCQCTIAELSETQVPPGGVATVKLNWKTETAEGPYRHTADILTSDPERPEVHLVLSGQVTQSVRVEPQMVVFGRFGFRDTPQREFTILAFHSDDFKVLDLSLVGMTDDEAASGNPPATADPLAKNAAFAHKPLTAEELKAADPLAKSGYRATVSLKPGLPLGPFERRIRIATNLPRPRYIDAVGAVVGDITVADGGGWIPRLEQFHLGEGDSAAGISRPLFLIVGGTRHRDVQVKVKETWPAELKAKMGTPELGNGIMRWPITISIPPGTPPMSHTDKGEYGKVVLETTHPDQKEFVIPVNFLVVKGRQ